MTAQIQDAINALADAGVDAMVSPDGALFVSSRDPELLVDVVDDFMRSGCAFTLGGAFFALLHLPVEICDAMMESISETSSGVH